MDLDSNSGFEHLFWVSPPLPPSWTVTPSPFHWHAPNPTLICEILHVQMEGGGGGGGMKCRMPWSRQTIPAQNEKGEFNHPSLIAALIVCSRRSGMLFFSIQRCLLTMRLKKCFLSYFGINHIYYVPNSDSLVLGHPPREQKVTVIKQQRLQPLGLSQIWVQLPWQRSERSNWS